MRKYSISLSDIEAHLQDLKKLEKNLTNILKEVIDDSLQEGKQLIISKGEEVSKYGGNAYINTQFEPTKQEGNKLVGRIITQGKKAVFNEYGTGIVGASSPHPNIPSDWIYDVNSHGEKGWWYPTDESDTNPYKWVDENGQLRAWTKGIEARAVHYEANKEIRKLIKKKIRQRLGGNK